MVGKVNVIYPGSCCYHLISYVGESPPSFQSLCKTKTLVLTHDELLSIHPSKKDCGDTAVEGQNVEKI